MIMTIKADPQQLGHASEFSHFSLTFRSNPMIPPHKAAMSIRKHQSSPKQRLPSFTKNQVLSILLALTCTISRLDVLKPRES